MVKLVIIYDSNTGNTELMTNAVAEGARNVQNVQVEVRKIGTRFSISILKDADAVIFGSPTIYGGISRSLVEFFSALNHLQAANHVNLKGKKGAAFGSYGWDRGWSTQRLERELQALGVNIVAPGVSAREQGAYGPIKTDADDLNKCRDLGKALAEAVAEKR
ncbi:flavodoxin domain-containing protein [Candidatus Bathyarchaeota archaeon]|jgi:flavorubredoxin|nr:flavodoxin domain-containing protein [Candidatus Bathyarchaeota archaeon]